MFKRSTFRKNRSDSEEECNARLGPFLSSRGAREQQQKVPEEALLRTPLNPLSHKKM
jgi:hypothetical protein